VKSWIRIYCP
jgi:hypothetical protein